MKKLFRLCLMLFLLFALTTGCTQESPDNGTPTPDTDQTEDQNITGNETEDDADTVTGSSIVTDEESLKTIMGSQGTWIVIFTEDMTTEEDLVLEGEFTNDDAKDRKIALYAQDEERNKTETYTLTAPQLTVRSENTRIQGGTFVGDVYVEADGFSVVDAEIRGNVYFANDQFKSTFTLTDGGSVTGTTEVQ